MTPRAGEKGARRAIRRRRGFRRKVAFVCAGAFLLAAVLFVTSLHLMNFLGSKSKEKFIRGRSGGRYTPAEAAKKLLRKIKGEE